ncbi:MAG: exonuclease SbcCD subunit D [Bacteroides sp.]|nr:exonuclease SbcCD subunit D [Bacteroides sp.]
MKILHTSDWHLGQLLYSYDRTEEYLDFFHQLKEIIRWEMPDALLVSGDIYDVSNPPASVCRLFKDTILELHSLVPDMAIIITAGNHDSASRIDIDRNLWKSNDIHVIGGIDKIEGDFDFSDLIIKVGNAGYVAALPFVNRLMLKKSKNEDSGERDLLSKLEEQVKAVNSEGLPVVLMAHLAVADCDKTGHRERTIGGFDTVDKNIFGNTFDYVALGHIHKQQKFNDGRIAYSGSPIAVSFDENFPHTVSIVNIKKDELPESEELVIKPLRSLRTIPEEGVAFKKALKVIDKLPDNDMSYIRLNVCQPEDLPVDCMEQAVARASGKSCRFCTFRFVSEVKNRDENITPELHTFEFKELSPVEVAETFFRSSGTDEGLSQAYLTLIAELENEIRAEDNV